MALLEPLIGPAGGRRRAGVQLLNYQCLKERRESQSRSKAVVHKIQEPDMARRVIRQRGEFVSLRTVPIPFEEFLVARHSGLVERVDAPQDGSPDIDLRGSLDLDRTTHRLSEAVAYDDHAVIRQKDSVSPCL